MKIDKIKEAININTKLVELGIDINSKDWESFNFKLDEWGNLIIKSGKLDHKPFVSAKSEHQYFSMFHKLIEGDEYSDDLGLTWRKVDTNQKMNYFSSRIFRRIK